MRLADEHITIELGGEFITLRPSLRCGFRLERRAGSFQKLISDLQEGSLTAAHFVLAEEFHHPAVAQCIMDAGLERICAKLILHAINCAGLDPDVKADPDAEPSNVTFGDHLTSLYRIGTGWLGWTPDVTLDATPAEIIEAYKGKIEFIEARNGGGKSQNDMSAKQTKRAMAVLGDAKVRKRRR
jgi:hypothetical protein